MVAALEAVLSRYVILIGILLFCILIFIVWGWGGDPPSSVYGPPVGLLAFSAILMSHHSSFVELRVELEFANDGLLYTAGKGV